VIRDLQGNEHFSVDDGELYIDRVYLYDTPDSTTFSFETWHIFSIGFGGLLAFLCILFLYFLAAGNCAEFDRAGEYRDPPASETGSANTIAGERVKGMRAIAGDILKEFDSADGLSGTLVFLLYLVVRFGVMVMMFMISYLGFVSFFFFSVVAIFSFIGALFINSFCQWPDVVAQFLMCWYFIPFFELLVSMNLEIITSFFKDIWENLSWLKVTEAFAYHSRKQNNVLRLSLLLWDLLYFAGMGFLFIACIVAPRSNIAVHLRSPFAIVCVIVPLCSLILPILVSWYILFHDRQNVRMPEGRFESGDPAELSISEIGAMESPAAARPVPEQDRPGQQRPEETWTPPRFLGKVNKFTANAGFRLFDPIGVLSDDKWVKFLS
jgi:hypothetical protein